MELLYKKEKEKEVFNKFLNCSKEEFDEDKISKSFPRMILKIFFKLSDDNIEEALRKLGSNDEGLDAFFIDEYKRTYYLIQFKSRTSYNEKNNKDADKAWFSLLDQITDKFNNDNFKSTNPRVMEIKKEINEDLYDFKHEKHIFHLGFSSEEIINNNENIKYINQTEILNKFVQYDEATLEESNIEELKITIESPNTKKINNEHNFIYFTPKAVQGNLRGTIIFPLNGVQVIELLKNGTTIFNRNIRGFLGEDQDVNKSIIATAKDFPTEFYYYNNGITITCNKFEINSVVNNNNPIVTLTQPQIINGAQTVSSIHYAYLSLIKEYRKKLTSEKLAIEKAQNHFRDIVIICKIIESNKGESTKLTQNITKYSNNQNKIKFSDFYSNRNEQKRLQEIFKDFNIIYDIKRGLHEKKGNISMEVLAENYWAQNINPFNAKISEIFNENFSEDNQETAYYKIFNNKVSYINDHKLAFLKTYFIYSVASKSFKEIKKILNQIEDLKNDDSKDAEGNIKKFINKLDEPTNDFYLVTNAKTFVQDYLNSHRKDLNSAEKNNILKFVDVMELKVLTYIMHEIIKKSYFRRLQDNKIVRINDIFEKQIKEKDIVNITKMLKKIIHKSLNIYGKITKGFNSKSDKEIKSSMKFRKTKDNIDVFMNLIEENIDDLTEDSYIVYDF
jgi:hypothetical protein